jgi:VRR-NUC domain.
MNYNESHLQTACVNWFRLQYPEYQMLLEASLNGARLTETQAKVWKANGMVAGVSDLKLLLPNRSHPFLCIELKTETGRQSPDQKKWQHEVENIALARYAIVRSVDEFMELITDYLNNR